MILILFFLCDLELYIGILYWDLALCMYLLKIKLLF